MNYFRFEIKTVRGMVLTTRFSGTEESGIRSCKKYIKDFRADFPDATLRIVIFERERVKNRWELHGMPFDYKKTLISKPKDKDGIEGDVKSHDAESI
ncbi:hypothetical protein ACFVS2_20795 [Brevibacillus sp. NPDC058079]|uniref:hypothetical protein n=1 Tax=Brevibacillus sp. NPDC058079 TaxID=3346330 RepID=UPI0036E124D4